MKREILTTNDGSTTIHLPDWDESYHSKHGAIQEAYHVFIKNGLTLFDGKKQSKEIFVNNWYKACLNNSVSSLLNFHFN